MMSERGCKHFEEPTLKLPGHPERTRGLTDNMKAAAIYFFALKEREKKGKRTQESNPLNVRLEFFFFQLKLQHNKQLKLSPLSLLLTGEVQTLNDCLISHTLFFHLNNCILIGSKHTQCELNNLQSQLKLIQQQRRIETRSRTSQEY